MEKPSLYIETSIAGYLAAEQSRDIITAARQEVTREWWNTRRSRFRLFTSTGSRVSTDLIDSNLIIYATQPEHTSCAVTSPTKRD